MSQLLEAPRRDESEIARESQPLPPDGGAAPDPEAFEYRPMPALAPVCAVLGFCSLTALLGLFGIALAAFGTLIGLLTLWQIHRSQGLYSGKGLVLGGLISSLLLGLSGVALQVYNYQHEVPDGYERVSFARQISARGFVNQDGYQGVHPEVEALTEKPIFLKGFMYPTNQEYNLTSFLMLKDSGQCCFGGQPELQDMIGVAMTPGNEVDYYNSRVAVAGKLKINPNYRGGSLEPLYLFEADKFYKARTSF